MNPIFISYTAKGRKNAERLRVALQEHGLETWMDSDILPGEDWANTSQKKLRHLEAAVFLIGPDGQVTEHQRNEATAVFRAEWGTQKKTPLIPVLTGEAELPPFLRQVQAIKVEDVETGWSEVAEKIKESLSGASVAVPEPASSGESEQKARLLEIWQFADSLPRSSKSAAPSETTGAATASGSSEFRRASKSSHGKR